MGKYGGIKTLKLDGNKSDSNYIGVIIEYENVFQSQLAWNRLKELFYEGKPIEVEFINY